MILSPGELLSWTKRISKLTSTRHKNIILRVAHGDVFSNSRLCRFNLTDNPGCKNCPAPSESILHRILECPNAVRAWKKLEELKVQIGLTALSDLTIENILGAKDRVTKIELALNAELIHKLAARSEHAYPDKLAKSVVRLIYQSEYVRSELKEAKENVIRD